MQDSLCGSMSLGLIRAPRSLHGSIAINSSNLDQPHSPKQPSSSPTVSGLSDGDPGEHLNVDLNADHSSLRSKFAKGMVGTIDQSLDHPNLACWFSDIIDELIGPSSLEDPMHFSPLREPISQSLNPSYSSFSDEFTKRQDGTSGPQSLQWQSSAHLFADHDGPVMESPQVPHVIYEDKQDALSMLSQIHLNYRQLPQQRHLHHRPKPSPPSPKQQQQQQQHEHHRHQHKCDYQQLKQEARSHFLLGQAQQSKTNMKASSSTLRSSNQPPSAVHKVVSVPQLSRPEPIRSPKRTPVAALPSIPANKTINYTKSSSSLSQSDIDRFIRKKSPLECSGNNSPQSHANSKPILPNSLPSMGSLSHRITQPARTAMEPPHHHHRLPQVQPSLQKHCTLMHPATSIHGNEIEMAGNGSRESVAPLQQCSSLHIMPSSNLVGQQDHGLHLVHLLLACAEAIAKADYFCAKETLLQLKQVASSTGDSMQRVAAYFTDALHARLTGTGGRSYMAILKSYDLATADAYQILYQACPYVKFAHFTSNQAIFEAFEGEDRVHIVDLDIIQGYQWPAFIQALAARPGGVPHLRITGVGMPYESVQETGKRLTELAESLRVPFEFHAVGERLENLKAYMLQRRTGEALAVNSVVRLHRLLSEPMSPLFGVLHMIREQAPNIFTLVEQEASHNGPFFLGRFLEALHYYSAIFDSLDAILPQTSPERAKLEEVVFSNEITNIVACEGGQRVERHEKLTKWREIMEAMGYENVALSANAVNQSKLLLGLYPCDGYTLVEDRGSLLLGWQERPIIAASAWRCI